MNHQNYLSVSIGGKKCNTCLWHQSDLEPTHRNFDIS